MTALTPAQVRDHARALIERFGAKGGANTLDYARRYFPAMTVEERVDLAMKLAHAVETARITVDWDEETA